MSDDKVRTYVLICERGCPAIHVVGTKATAREKAGWHRVVDHSRQPNARKPRIKIGVVRPLAERATGARP